MGYDSPYGARLGASRVTAEQDTPVPQDFLATQKLKREIRQRMLEAGPAELTRWFTTAPLHDVTPYPVWDKNVLRPHKNEPLPAFRRRLPDAHTEEETRYRLYLDHQREYDEAVADFPEDCIIAVEQAVEVLVSDQSRKRPKKAKRDSAPAGVNQIARAWRWLHQWPLHVALCRILGRDGWRTLLPPPGTEMTLF